MPHIVVEYSESLRFNLPGVLHELHTRLAAEESVDIRRIKTRGIPLKDTVVGEKGAAGEMVHVALKLMPRPPEVAKKMASDLQGIIRSHVKPEVAVTVEVVELNPATYCA